jgi:hypothetical protein
MRVWLSCQFRHRPWQTARQTDSGRSLVVYAKGGKSATKTRRQQHDNSKAPGASRGKSKLSQMVQFKADEVLLFDPVPAGRNAALQVVYAYPNEYSVGITSLGYQLVSRHLTKKRSRLGSHP